VVVRYPAILLVIITLLCPRFKPDEVMFFDIRMLPTVEQIVVEEAVRQEVPAHLMLAIAYRESHFNPRLVSETDDWGVMQLNWYTWKALHVKDPLNAQLNIIAGVGLWASYYKTGGQEYAMCAYARGPQKC
jgi:soluble lytic murein transglycosylase-like protein